MIVEKHTVIIEHEKRISDYCVGCPYYEPEETELRPTHILEHCKHGNTCDHLYSRLKGDLVE